MNIDLKVKNFSDYKSRMFTYVGEDETNAIFEYVGGEDAVMDAPFANTLDTGFAYEGSLVEALLNITTYAIKINQLLPKEKQVDIKSIVKVGLLHHISKVMLYQENDNTWEVNNRGMIYKYNDCLDGALRVGERSILIAANSGVKFTELEYEAMRIMDKNNDDNYSKYYSSTLSTVIRQANELVTLITKK